MTRKLYTYLPRQNTAQRQGILSTRLAPHGWQKYRDRMGVTTREEVLDTLDKWQPGRSRAVSVFTQPIGQKAGQRVRAFADSHSLYQIDYDKLHDLALIQAVYRVIRNRKGTRKVNQPNWTKVDWQHTQPRPGGLGLSNAPHYLVVLKNGKVPPELTKRIDS